MPLTTNAKCYFDKYVSRTIEVLEQWLTSAEHVKINCGQHWTRELPHTISRPFNNRVGVNKDDDSNEHVMKGDTMLWCQCVFLSKAIAKSWQKHEQKDGHVCGGSARPMTTTPWCLQPDNFNKMRATQNSKKQRLQYLNKHKPFCHRKVMATELKLV